MLCLMYTRLRNRVMCIPLPLNPFIAFCMPVMDFAVCLQFLHAGFLAIEHPTDAPVIPTGSTHMLALALQMKEAAEFREVKLKGKNHILKTGHYRLKNELKSDHKKVEQLQEQVPTALCHAAQ